MSADDGGPAFPQPVIPGHTQVKRIEDGQVVSLAAGMSLADYFAAQAIPELIAHRDRYRAAIDRFREYNQTEGGDSRMVASLAYDISDAMLAERQKRMEAKA